jgi:hypothetical protein
MFVMKIFSFRTFQLTYNLTKKLFFTMFKNFKPLLFLTVTATVVTIVACSSNNEDLDQNAVTTKQTNIVARTISKTITTDLLDLGVQEVKDDGKTITFVTYNDFFFKKNLTNFAKYTISYDESSLTTNSSKLVIDSKGEAFLAQNGGKLVNLREISMDALSADGLVLVLTNGQINGGGSGLTFDQYQTLSSAGGGGGCPIWNIRRAAGVGFTQEESDADLWAATANFISSHQGCTSIGGVGHKSIGVGGFGFEMSIQSFCCK